MLFKIPLIIGLMYLYINTEKPLLCASIWGIATLFLAALFDGGFSWLLLLNAGVSFLLALGVFALLDYLVKGLWWWMAFILGIAVLLFIA